MNIEIRIKISITNLDYSRKEQEEGFMLSNAALKMSAVETVSKKFFFLGKYVAVSHGPQKETVIPQAVRIGRGLLTE